MLVLNLGRMWMTLNLHLMSLTSTLLFYISWIQTMKSSDSYHRLILVPNILLSNLASTKFWTRTQLSIISCLKRKRSLNNKSSTSSTWWILAWYLRVNWINSYRQKKEKPKGKMWWSSARLTIQRIQLCLLSLLSTVEVTFQRVELLTSKLLQICLMLVTTTGNSSLERKIWSMLLRIWVSLNLHWYHFLSMLQQIIIFISCS